MALTRKMLSGMGLTAEQVDAIIDEHTSVTQGLIADRDKYKADAEKLPGVQKQLDDLQKGDNDWKQKYEKEHSDFEAYKKDVDGKETAAKVREAYQKLLEDAGVATKHVKAVLRATDFSGMKLDKDGNLEGADKLTESIKSDWADFISTTSTQGTGVQNPPAKGGKAKTKEEILAIKDTTERQQAMAENIELFQ